MTESQTWEKGVVETVEAKRRGRCEQYVVVIVISRAGAGCSVNVQILNFKVFPCADLAAG